MYSSLGGLRLAPQALACDVGPLHVLSQSPLCCVFCSDLVSHGCRDGCHAAVLGFHSGVCISTVFFDTPSSAQAMGLQGGGHHSDCSVLAAEGVVSGSSGTAPGSSSSSAGEVGPPATTLFSQIPSAIVFASSSCVETIKLFAMAFYCRLGLWCLSLLGTFDSIGSKVLLATSSPFGSSQCQLAFGSAVLPVFLGGIIVSLPLGFGAVVSCFSTGVFCVFFFSFLLYERALFLVEASDSGSQVSLSDMVALWDESGFSLGPLSRSDLRVTLATW